MNQETNKNLEDYKEETKRHFDVVTEDLTHKIEIIGEGVTSNSQGIEAVKSEVEKKLRDIGSNKIRP